MPRTFLTQAAACALLSCLCLTAAAQDAAQSAAFRDADQNRSGSVSLEEFRNYAVDVFHRLDADHDGTVTPKEYPGVDKNVAIKDFNAALNAHFVQYDADRSNALDRKEWTAVPSADPRKPTDLTK